LNKARHTFKIIFPMLILILTMGILAACQKDNGEDTAVSPTPAIIKNSTSPSDSVIQIAENPAEDPATLPEEELAPDECLNCHIDKELLIQTANPEEVVISENEGEG